MDNEEDRKLWCGNLPSEATEELLYELFLQAGPLERVNIPKDRTGRQRNFAFITYKHSVSVPYAIQLFGGLTLFSRQVRLQGRTGGSNAEYPVTLSHSGSYTVPNGTSDKINPLGFQENPEFYPAERENVIYTPDSGTQYDRYNSGERNFDTQQGRRQHHSSNGNQWNGQRQTRWSSCDTYTSQEVQQNRHSIFDRNSIFDPAIDQRVQMLRMAVERMQTNSLLASNSRMWENRY